MEDQNKCDFKNTIEEKLSAIVGDLAERSAEQIFKSLTDLLGFVAIGVTTVVNEVVDLVDGDNDAPKE